MTLFKRPGTSVGLTLWLVAALLWMYGMPRGPHTFAQPIPVPAATTNQYWAGYIAADSGPYTAIQATWTVPVAPCAPAVGRNATAYVWIGEGGYLRGLASPLIQVGTASDCLAGMASYHAFYEWYPGIYATDFPIAVRPGDSVTARLEESMPDFWTLSVRDETTALHSTTATFYRPDTGSAELVVERPTLCAMWGCGQVDLGRFGSVTFHDIAVQTATGPQPGADLHAAPIALVDGSGRQLAVPARVYESGDTLSVLWRGPS